MNKEQQVTDATTTEETVEVDWEATAAAIAAQPDGDTGRPVRGQHADLVRDVVPEADPVVVNNTTVMQSRLAVDNDPTALTIEKDGAVLFKNRIIGEFDGSTLTLNAGWCRIAGLGIKVEGDSTDRRRVVFEREVTDHHLSSRS